MEVESADIRPLTAIPMMSVATRTSSNVKPRCFTVPPAPRAALRGSDQRARFVQHFCDSSTARQSAERCLRDTKETFPAPRTCPAAPEKDAYWPLLPDCPVCVG